MQSVESLFTLGTLGQKERVRTTLNLNLNFFDIDYYIFFKKDFFGY